MFSYVIKRAFAIAHYILSNGKNIIVLGYKGGAFFGREQENGKTESGRSQVSQYSGAIY